MDIDVGGAVGTPPQGAGTTGSGRIASVFAPTPPTIAEPSLSLPKSGGAIRGIGEKLSANPATGTASMTVPIATSPGRSGFGPTVSLTYDSGHGNGEFGFGWSLSLPAVTRRTDKGLPKYDSSDVYLLSGAEDLVAALAPTGPGGAWTPVTQVSPPHAPEYRIERYRPRTEGLFARIERWIRLADGDTHWRSVTRDNVANWYGLDTNSRVADPADPTRVFSWLLCRSEDGRGNAISYEYLAENSDGVDEAQAHEGHRNPDGRTANRYIKRIRYGNRISTLVDPQAPDAGWMFETVFDYGEHDQDAPTPAAVRPLPCRTDPFSSYRAGFEARTYRLCRRVLMFHHFPTEEGIGPDCLVGSTDFSHKVGDAVATLLTSVTQRGYRRDGDGYRVRSTPAVEFGYTPSQLQAQLREVDPASVANLPAGMGGAGYQWADLDGEGITGVLVAGFDAWFYKPSLGDGRFGPLQPVPGAPPPGVGAPAAPRLMDLAGNGQLDLVTFAGPTPGFIERSPEGGWLPWRPFAALPTMDLDRSDVRMVDLNGDGHADLLVTEGESLTWYPSLAEAGFGAGITLSTAPDSEAGPRVVFADGTQSLHLADMSGDGLVDLVRVRNGSVCYWPNLGHGRFGAKVTMDDAPWFDSHEEFDQRRLRLSDVDGSGPTDLIYLGADGVRVHLNRSGNGWAPTVILPGLPPADAGVVVDAVDLLGTGTTCLVWSSTHATDGGRPMRYADLMGGVKPHLMEQVVNNLGAETLVRYAPSTRFYLADRAAGRPWHTRLPFPVQVVERVETYDRISRNRFVARYAYHHGFFDGIDREFRGFGLTEQWDTEELSTLVDVDLTDASNVDPVSHVPPVLTKTWFHTGAFVDLGQSLSERYAQEYWREPGLTEVEQDALLLPGQRLPEELLLADGTRVPYRLATEELREACRALKGSTLRQEVYALDGSVEQERPYQVSQSSLVVELLQPMAGQAHGVCLTRSAEAVTYHHERRLYDIERVDGTVALADPRVSHELTLEVDGCGNVLRGVSVAYGRRYPDADLDPRLPAWAAAAVTVSQTATRAVATENRLTNAVDEPGAYRTPLPGESRTYELIHVPTAVPALLRLDEVRALCDAAGDGGHDLPYEDVEAAAASTTAPYRRLVEHVRSLYRRDDLAGPLPLGQVQALGLPYENYALALTPGLITSVYRQERDGVVTDLLPDAAAVLRDEGGYVLGDDHRSAALFPADDPDGQWWTPSGRLHHSPGGEDSPAAELAHAVGHFFLPGRFVDPFGNVSTISYDGHDLLTVELRDPLGNLTTAGERDPDGGLVAGGNDYRVLAPALVSDANRNRSVVAYDALGMVVGTAVMGKPEERLGDTLVGFDPDPDDGVIASYLGDPLADPHGLLGQASTRLVYDLFAFERTRLTPDPQPAVVASMARENHVSDLATGQQSQVQSTFTYSDGFGREIQKKVAAEAGPLVPGGADVGPRWVGSGWTIFNNKGKPVRQYEPFFTPTHLFEFAREEGVSPVRFYDPAGRTVVTLHPNDTWDKVVFDPWQQASWDVNDTVLIDLGQDIDAGGFVASYLANRDGWRSWYEQRASGDLGPAEQAAAGKAAGHAATPANAWSDVLGRTALGVAHHRTDRDGGLVEELHPTRSRMDIEGNVRDVTDPRGRVVMRHSYTMLADQVEQASMEAGRRLVLNDVTGKQIRTWKDDGASFRVDYDLLRRPVRWYVREQIGALMVEQLRERIEYGESRADGVLRNLRTRVFQTYDGAGVATIETFDYKGNPLLASRQLATEYRESLDWSNPVPLEERGYVTSTRYDALNRPMSIAAPDGTVIVPTFNVTGLIRRLTANLRGAQESTTIVAAIAYNARAQRASISYGNGAETTYEYDPLTLRLTRLLTSRSGAVMQDLGYAYDPAGNITGIRDAAQQTLFFRNRLVEPSADYTYDALYRLVAATGREHLGQLSGALVPLAGSVDDAPRVGLSHPNDGMAMSRYVQRYDYDAAGNILAMFHSTADPAGPGWTRSYSYAEPSLIEPAKFSNRLSGTSEGGEAPQPIRYDSHGNVTAMPELTQLRWSAKDELRATVRQVVTNGGTPETTYYVYDSAGQRVRKVTDRYAPAGQAPARKSERIYLAGFEILREYGANGEVTLERETVHIEHEGRAVARLETRTQGSDDGPAQLLRYQLANHLGSATLELDALAQIISYEEYYPFGCTSYQGVRSQTEAPKRYRYTGRERDTETGLCYHGARYYAPWLGRWSGADPAGLVDGTNLYVYGANSPVCKADPLGHTAQEEINYPPGEPSPAEIEVIGERPEPGFWDTGFGKGLAFAAGAVVGLATGVATGIVIAAAIATLPISATAAAVVGVGLAVGGLGAAGYALFKNREQVAEKVNRLGSGEATAEEWFGAGLIVGGIASIFAGGKTGALGKSLGTGAREAIFVEESAALGAGAEGGILLKPNLLEGIGIKQRAVIHETKLDPKVLEDEGLTPMSTTYKNGTGLDRAYADAEGELAKVAELKTISSEHIADIEKIFEKLASTRYGVQGSPDYTRNQSVRLITSPKSTEEMVEAGLLIDRAMSLWPDKVKHVVNVMDEFGNIAEYDYNLYEMYFW